MVRKRTAVADDDGDDKRRSNREAFEEGAEEGTSRRRSRDEDSPRSRRRSGGDDDEPSSRRGRDEDDEDEREERQSLRKGAVGTGWDSYKKQKASAGDFPDEFKVENAGDKYLIRFLDTAPVATYKQHWIERPGKKSFTCLGAECPLCDILGDRPRVLAVFNVVDMGYNGPRKDPSDPSLKIWIVGTRIAETLKELTADEKSGPLTKYYYSVTKSGKGSKTNYNLSPVKERDLDDDWGVQALDDKELEEFEESAYGDEVVQVQTRRQLLEIAEEEAGD